MGRGRRWENFDEGRKVGVLGAIEEVSWEGGRKRV